MDTDASQTPTTMIINSSELGDTDFDLREVIPLQLEEMPCGDRCTLGSVLKQIQDMTTRRYVICVETTMNSGHYVSESPQKLAKSIKNREEKNEETRKKLKKKHIGGVHPTPPIR